MSAIAVLSSLLDFLNFNDQSSFQLRRKVSECIFLISFVQSIFVRELKTHLIECHLAL